MQPGRFMQNYVCECFQPYNYCNCPDKSQAVDILWENANQVAQTLVEVMVLCGIPTRKAKRSVGVIIYYLLHYQEIRHRIDAVPKKCLFKEDLLHDLHRKCDMTRSEAQMCCSVIKRAFRAFYHCTGEGGVPSPLSHRQLVHTPECMWIHASKRTAQIVAAYEGMFPITQKDIECKIKELYKNLHDRIAQKDLTEGNHECSCLQCAKRIMRESLKTVRVTTRMHKIADPYEEMYSQIVNEMEKSLAIDVTDLENVEGKRCTCPPLKMVDSDYMYRQAAESCNTGYSQGPFHCHWAPITKEEYEADNDEPNIDLPEEYPCPSCTEDISSRDSECECTCEVCTCESKNEFDCEGEGEEGADDGKESSVIEIEEEAAVNIKSVNGIESLDVSGKQFSLKFAGYKNPAKILETVRMQINSTGDIPNSRNVTIDHSKFNGSSSTALGKRPSKASTESELFSTPPAFSLV